jgi:hypothetical protein
MQSLGPAGRVPPGLITAPPEGSKKKTGESEKNSKIRASKELAWQTDFSSESSGIVKVVNQPPGRRFLAEPYGPARLNPGFSDEGENWDKLGILNQVLARDGVIGIRDGHHARKRVREIRDFIYGWAASRNLIHGR